MVTSYLLQTLWLAKFFLANEIKGFFIQQYFLKINKPFRFSSSRETYENEMKKLTSIKLSQAWIKFLIIIREARKFSDWSPGVQIISERSVKVF